MSENIQKGINGEKIVLAYRLDKGDLDNNFERVLTLANK